MSDADNFPCGSSEMYIFSRCCLVKDDCEEAYFEGNERENACGKRNDTNHPGNGENVQNNNLLS
jgi:hypothetical protein